METAKLLAFSCAWHNDSNICASWEVDRTCGGGEGVVVKSVCEMTVAADEVL